MAPTPNQRRRSVASQQPTSANRNSNAETPEQARERRRLQAAKKAAASRLTKEDFRDNNVSKKVIDLHSKTPPAPRRTTAATTPLRTAAPSSTPRRAAGAASWTRQDPPSRAFAQRDVEEEYFEDTEDEEEYYAEVEAEEMEIDEDQQSETFYETSGAGNQRHPSKRRSHYQKQIQKDMKLAAAQREQFMQLAKKKSEWSLVAHKLRDIANRMQRQVDHTTPAGDNDFAREELQIMEGATKELWAELVDIAHSLVKPN